MGLSFDLEAMGSHWGRLGKKRPQEKSSFVAVAQMLCPGTCPVSAALWLCVRHRTGVGTPSMTTCGPRTRCLWTQPLALCYAGQPQSLACGLGAQHGAPCPAQDAVPRGFLLAGPLTGTPGACSWVRDLEGHHLIPFPGPGPEAAVVA